MTRTKQRLLARIVDEPAACPEPVKAIAAAAAPAAPGASAGASAAARPGGATTKSRRGAFKPPPVAAPNPHSPLVRAVSLSDAPAPLRPLLFALLAIAIGLLAAAAVPNRVLPAGAVTAFVAARRAYLAAAGVWLLAVVAALTVLT